MEQQEKQDKTIRKLKKQLKFHMKRVEDFEGNIVELCFYIKSLIFSRLHGPWINPVIAQIFIAVFSECK